MQPANNNINHNPIIKKQPKLNNSVQGRHFSS
jgi:hypothetical protein